MKISRKNFLRNVGLGAAGLGLDHGWAQEPMLPEFDPAAPSAYWSAIRTDYDIDPDLRYFNSGGLGPCSRSVKAFTARVEAELEAPVETGYRRLDSIRPLVGAFLGAQADEVAFVRNATEGNGIVAGGLDLRSGDEVIFESHAHPGGSFPWIHQARIRGVVIRMFEPDPESVAANLERLAALITDRTRAVQVSHVTAPTGILMPVRPIAHFCREHGLWFHVDGAQSAGMIPVNFAAMQCDSYATSGHKWVGAPRETGVLIVKRFCEDAVTPPLIGDRSGVVETLPGPMEYVPGALRYEYGTRDVARIAGLAEAMRRQESIGRERIADHGRALVKRLRAGLQEVPDVEILSPQNPRLGSAMLSFSSSRMPFEDLFSVLWNRHRMRCRPVSERGLNAVRVSCHLFNTADDIDRLVEAIAGELKSV